MSHRNVQVLKILVQFPEYFGIKVLYIGPQILNFGNGNFTIICMYWAEKFKLVSFWYKMHVQSTTQLRLRHHLSRVWVAIASPDLHLSVCFLSVIIYSSTNQAETNLSPYINKILNKKYKCWATVNSCYLITRPEV